MMAKLSICQYCGKEFKHTCGDKRPRLCCSRKCKGLIQTKKATITKVCIICKQEFSRKGSLFRGKRSKGLYCSMKCLGIARSGENNHKYKNGKFIDRFGYVHVLIAKGKYEKEHRVVMSKQIGRMLYSHEEVHHRNGDRQDNRLENLELWTTSHPSSQRVEDKIKWAKEILLEYDNIGGINGKFK